MLGLIIHLDCFKNKFFSFNLQSNSNFIRNFNEIDKENRYRTRLFHIGE